MTIKYKEKEYPIELNYSVIKAFAKEKGQTKIIELSGLMGESFEDLELLCYLGLKQGHKKAGIPFEIDGKEITMQDVEEIFNESINEFLTLLK